MGKRGAAKMNPMPEPLATLLILFVLMAIALLMWASARLFSNPFQPGLRRRHVAIVLMVVTVFGVVWATFFGWLSPEWRTGIPIGLGAVLMLGFGLVIQIRALRECPQCGGIITTGSGITVLMKYCPYCGTKLPPRRGRPRTGAPAPDEGAESKLSQHAER